ncbi:hypothetical protein PMIN04_005256 [Paraphaeosphaeria minitans]
MAPLAPLVSLLSLFHRAPKYPAYVTITTEQQAPCRIHADNMPYSVHSFAANNKLNVSCWAASTMQDNKGRLNDNEGSFTYLWVNTNGSFGPPAFLSYPGVGNADQGGKARGEGCWLHEDSVKEGADVDFTEALEWCGEAPHHQIGAPGTYNAAFVCRNCTDLTNATCQTEYPTQEYGYVDVGCWKRGSEVKGNTTWVQMVNPGTANCYISPDQFDPKEWHGLPASECKD